MLLFKGWLNLEFCAASALWKARSFFMPCCFPCTSSAMHPAALKLLSQVTIACLHWPDWVSGARTAKAPGKSFSSCDPESWLLQCIQTRMHVLSSSCSWHEGLRWGIWKTLEWATGMCHQFPRQPHSSHLKWMRQLVLLRRHRSLKDQSGTPKINEKSWSLSFSCERLWAGHASLDQSIKWSLDISPWFSWNLEMPLDEHKRAPSFYTLNVCLLLNWCRKPKCLKSSKGNVDCGNHRVFSQIKAWTCEQ